MLTKSNIKSNVSVRHSDRITGLSLLCLQEEVYHTFCQGNSLACLIRCSETPRGETKALIWGGGGEYSYIRVLPDEFLLKLTLMTADFKRNLSGRTRRYEYSPPPPPN